MVPLVSSQTLISKANFWGFYLSMHLLLDSLLQQGTRFIQCTEAEMMLNGMEESEYIQKG